VRRGQQQASDASQQVATAQEVGLLVARLKVEIMHTAADAAAIAKVVSVQELLAPIFECLPRV
jgi:hypothetical protein